VSTWLIVWFVIGLVSTAALLVFLVGLVRHVMIVGRAAREMQEAVAPLAEEIGAGSDRASSRMQGLPVPGGAGSRGKTTRR
jgi:hypothetical protein